MAKFTGELTEPNIYAGRGVTHDSTAAAIGAGLGGLAQILDVGLKASAEAREKRVVGGVENQLAKAAQEGLAPEQPKLIGEPTGTPAENAAKSTETYTAADSQMDKYKQAYQQGRMSRQELLARFSKITSEAVHENPRFATEIRQRAQEVLGFNPTAEGLKLQYDEQKAAEERQRAITSARMAPAIAKGFYVGDGHGGVDEDQTALVGDAISHSAYQIAQIKDRLATKTAGLEYENALATNANIPLEHDIKEQNLKGIKLENALREQKLLHPEPAGGNEGITSAQAVALNTNLTPAWQAVIAGGVKNLNNMLDHPERFPELAGKSPEEVMLTVQKNANEIKYNWDQYVRETVSKNPQLRPAAINEVAGLYDKDWERINKAFTGDLSTASIVARQAKFVNDATSVSIAKLAPVLHMLNNVHSIAAQGAVQALIANDPKVQKQLDDEVGNFFMPSAADAADHIKIFNGLGLGRVTYDQIPNSDHKKVYLRAQEAYFKQLGKSNEKLDPKDVGAYENHINAYLPVAMSEREPTSIMTAANNLNSPEQLALFKQFDKEKKGGGKDIGIGIFNLQTDSIATNARALTVDKKGDVAIRQPGSFKEERDTVTNLAYYNPAKGRVEITSFGSKPGNENLVGVAPSSVSQNLRNAVNGINRALYAIEVLGKDYAPDELKGLNERQIKQKLVEQYGIAITPGVAKVEMPGDKKEGTIKAKVKK